MEKNKFLPFMGLVLIFMSLAIIGNSFITQAYSQILTTRWNMSLFFIVILTFSGIFLLELGNRHRIIVLVGLIHFLLASTIYIYFGYTHSFLGVYSIIDFLAFLTLFFIISYISTFCLKTAFCLQVNSFTLIPHICLILLIIYLIELIIKYIFKSAYFFYSIFLGEIIIFITGFIITILLYEAVSNLKIKESRRSEKKTKNSDFNNSSNINNDLDLDSILGADYDYKIDKK